MNYYDVLGVKVKASRSDIRRAHRRLAARFHPDRRRRVEVDAETDPFAGEDPVKVFNIIQTAYDVLADDLKRAMYDIVSGLESGTDEELAHMAELKRERSRVTVENMRNSFEAIRRKERERGGLIVLSARYSVKPDIATGQGLVVDVTVPVQCMVDASKLVVAGGESKSWLPGFYDPRPGAPKQLWVLYEFRGALHELVVDDTADLRMPLRSHCLPADAAPADVSARHLATLSSRRRVVRVSAGGSVSREDAESAFLRRQQAQTRTMILGGAAVVAVVGAHVLFPEACAAGRDTAIAAARRAALPVQDAVVRAAHAGWEACPVEAREAVLRAVEECGRTLAAARAGASERYGIAARVVAAEAERVTVWASETLANAWESIPEGHRARVLELLAEGRALAARGVAAGAVAVERLAAELERLDAAVRENAARVVAASKDLAQRHGW